MNLLRLLSPMVAILVLTACESAPPRPNFPDIHITGEAPILLAVGGIDVRNDFKPSFQPPHVEHLYPIPPAHAMENWARDRLVGLVGGKSNARAVFIIADASVVESELKKKEEGITGAFTKEPAQRYDATVEATLNIIDDRGTPVRTVTVKAFRSQTVLEGITPNEREQAWYDMTKALMNDFDRQMTTEISSHFGGYFQ